MALAATPLRQVMSKTIQRAIRKHVENSDLYKRSPLDLRMSPAVRRSGGETSDENRTPEHPIMNRKRRSIELRSASTLETVYETAKGTDIANDDDEHRNPSNVIKKNASLKGETPETDKMSADGNTYLLATPADSISRVNSGAIEGHEHSDVWYTPLENIETKLNISNEVVQ